MFADDCVLYIIGTSWDDIVYRPLQTSLETNIRWGNDHNFSLNATKPKAMVVCNRAKREYIHHAHFNAGNSIISFVNLCYLCCIIDKDLSMLPQYNYKAVYRKVEQKIFMLCKQRYLLDKNRLC